MSNPRKIREVLRMDKEIFEKLCSFLTTSGLLTRSSAISVEEQVAIFLLIVGSRESNRRTQKRFQHSGDTISKYFYLYNRKLSFVNVD